MHEIAAMDHFEPLIRFIMWLAVGWFGLGAFLLFYESIRPRSQEAAGAGTPKEKVGPTIWKSSLCGGAVIACLWYIVHPSPGGGGGARTETGQPRNPKEANSQATPARAQVALELSTGIGGMGSVGRPTVQVPGEKSVELTGITCFGSRVSAQTAAVLNPGETLVATIKFPDGRTETGVTTFIARRRGEKVSMYHNFSWSLPDSFGTNDTQSAIEQILSAKPAQASQSIVDKLVRKAMGTPTATNPPPTSRLLAVQPGRPLALFTLTNDTGGTVVGFLEFTRAAAQPDANGKVEAVVRINDPASSQSGMFPRPIAPRSIRTITVPGMAPPTLPGMASPMLSLQISYRPTVPPGYSLAPLARISEQESGEYGEVSTTHAYTMFPVPWSSTWQVPASFGTEGVSNAMAQAMAQSENGPIHVEYGKPAVVFSITNKAGDTFQGVFDLKGPRPEPTK